MSSRKTFAHLKSSRCDVHSRPCRVRLLTKVPSQVLKAENTEKIREIIRTSGHEDPISFRFNVGMLPCIDQEWQKHAVRSSEVKDFYIKDGTQWNYADVNVPKTYRNGFERLITDTEIVDIIKSITTRPFVFERSLGTCVVKYVQ